MVKRFDKDFDAEIRVRNGVHHHSAFEDLTIDRLWVQSSMSRVMKDKGWDIEYSYHIVRRQQSGPLGLGVGYRRSKFICRRLHGLCLPNVIISGS